ncbi:hypothetical protein NKH77_11525 [Streptomyces sp. M19]
MALFDAASDRTEGCSCPPGSTPRRCARSPGTTCCPASSAAWSRPRPPGAPPPPPRTPPTRPGRWPNGSPGSPRPSRAAPCWSWCAATWRPCSASAAARRSTRTPVQGDRVRLADRGGAAQPAQHVHRPEDARHARLRLPHPVLLAEHLREQLVPEGPSRSEALIQELDRLEDGLTALADDAERDAVASRLEALLARFRKEPAPAEGAAASQRLRSASADEVLDFIDSELGMA